MTSSSPLPTASRGTPVMAGSRLFPKSSSASNILSPTFPGQISSGDPVRASVAHLLVRAYTLPCSTAAQAFSQLVQPTARFQLALDALLPLLNSSVEVSTLLSAPVVHLMFTTSPPVTSARSTHSRFIHLVFNVRSLPDFPQPVQVCSVCYLPKGERLCHQNCRRRCIQ